MKSWQLFRRNFKETYRDPLALGLLFVLPLLVVIILKLADVRTGFLSPWVFLLGLLLMLLAVSRLLLRDRMSGYLRRLRTTPTRPGEFFLGYFLLAAILVAVEILMLMLWVRVFGIG